MKNYFNTLSFVQKLDQLGKSRFINREECISSLKYLHSKNIVIVGCGSQGFNQGLNMRDSGLNISFALRKESIINKSDSWFRAVNNDFKVGIYVDMIPEADLVINLTPDKYHSLVIQEIQPLMKYNSCLGYSHGFNIVEEGQNIRDDITVIMVAPKCPGTEVREEYKRGFGVPALIAIHSENDPRREGIYLAKAWANAIGSDKAGVLESSFVAEVKSDLMGEQTILCGMLQAGSLLCFDKMVNDGFDILYSCKLVQYGWQVITESLKHGGITLMMDRLSNTAKLRAFELSEELKILMQPLFEKHMENILTGSFAEELILDWNNKDTKLLNWRGEVSKSNFENALKYQGKINEQDYFNCGVLMVAMLKAGIELAFDIMLRAGISPECAYYESLHELPLIANTLARKRLYEMNYVISDTAEYGSYLFSHSFIDLFNKNFLCKLKRGDLGVSVFDRNIDNLELLKVNSAIRQHPIEIIGSKLRSYMKDMKTISITE